MRRTEPRHVLLTQSDPSARASAYGADGTWTMKGTTNLDTGPSGSDALKVIGGTGRYRGARGTLRHTLFSDLGVSGLSISRLRGKLRFP